MCMSKGRKTRQDMCVIKDPLGPTHSFTSSDQYFHAAFVLYAIF